MVIGLEVGVRAEEMLSENAAWLFRVKQTHGRLEDQCPQLEPQDFEKVKPRPANLKDLHYESGRPFFTHLDVKVSLSDCLRRQGKDKGEGCSHRVCREMP